MTMAAEIQNLTVRVNMEQTGSTGAVKNITNDLKNLDASNKLVTSSTSQLSAAQKYGVNLASNSSVAFGILKASTNDLGAAMSHAKGFVSNLISGPLGMIGLGAAAFSVAGAMKSGIDTANELASAIEKLVPITGDSAEQVSALIAVFEKFGISSADTVKALAMMEKNVGNLTLTTASATKFQKEFGVSLVDASGHVKDANTILALAADYFNSAASSADKAAFESKLFGRSWQTMIPILQLGSKGLTDAEKAAADLGLTLNAQNVGDLKNYQAAMRDAGEAVNGLKLTLALVLIPTLTDLSKKFTAFVTDHRTDIKQFFLGAVAAAKTVGSALMSVGQLAKSAWDAIPGPLQTLMIQALIGNKVIKTVFGVDIVGSVAGAVATMGKDILGKLVGGLFGKTIATPVVNVDGAVVNVGGGKIPGLPGGAAGAGEGAAAGGAAEAAGGLSLAGAVAIVAPLAVAAAVPLIINQIANSNPAQTEADAYQGRELTAIARRLDPGQVPKEITSPLAAWLAKNNGSTVAVDAAVKKDNIDSNRSLELLAQDINHGTSAEGAAFQFANSALGKIVGLTSAQTTAIDGNLNLQRIANESHHKLTYAQLLAIQHTEHMDAVQHAALVNKQLGAAAKILTSSESSKQKIADLNKIQAAFSAKSDWGPAAKIKAEIATLLPPLGAANAKLQAIKDKSESFIINISVTARSTQSNNVVVKRVGPKGQGAGMA